MAYEQMSEALSWFESVGVNLWNFCVLERGMVGHERARDAAEVRKSCGWAWVKNREGRDVYIRPARGLVDWPIVFLDDLPPKKALAISQKYTSMVIETSRANCQVWIATTEPLDESQRGQVQGRLLRLVGADPGSVSGEHFGRAPGYKNRKPGRGGWLVRVLAATSGARLDASPHLMTPTPTARPMAGPSLPQGGAGVFMGYGANAGSDGAGESEREYRYALARFGWAIRTGRDPSGEVLYLVANVADRAAARGKSGHGTRERYVQYAEMTVHKALQQILQQQQSA